MEHLLLRFREISLRSAEGTCSACRSFSSSTARNAAASSQRRSRDPYLLAQARAKKAANISRQAEIQTRRQQELGDPVRGKETPFVKAFDDAHTPSPADSRSQRLPLRKGAASTKSNAEANNLNFFTSPKELQASLDRSLLWSGQKAEIAAQLDDMTSGSRNSSGSGKFDLLNPNPNSTTHRTASEALKRIASLQNSSSKDRFHVNVARCVSTFGRHETDKHLPARPTPSESYLAEQYKGKPPATKTPRAGPDTGSSEVQVAILTARIRTLQQYLETRGKHDKIGKRNLRLLVHKRQKQLKYLERKERGGPRFQNVVEVLGLTPAAWEGEITLR